MATYGAGNGNYPDNVDDSDFAEGGWATEQELNEEYYSMEFYKALERVEQAKSLASGLSHLKDAADILKQAEHHGYDDIKYDKHHNEPMQINAIGNLMTLLRNKKDWNG